MSFTVVIFDLEFRLISKRPMIPSIYAFAKITYSTGQEDIKFRQNGEKVI